jgi:restriction system protein
MSIPDFQSIMRPLLELAADGKEHSISEATETLGETFKLTEEEKMVLLPSGRQTTFRSRTGWANSILLKLGFWNRCAVAFSRSPSAGVDCSKIHPAVSR